MASHLTPSSYQIPDLSCPFPLTYYKDWDSIAAATDKWFADNCNNFTEARRRRLHELKAGELVAYCYSHAVDDDHLRVVCDFMNFYFHLDDFSDGLVVKDTILLEDVVMNAFDFPYVYRRTLADGRELPEEEPEASRLARDFWKRCIQHAGPIVQARYLRHMRMYFEAVKAQAKSRQEGSLPDLETFMHLRRNQSGCRVCFDMMEYAFDIELPEDVFNNPILQTLSDCTVDFVALSNDIFSYNVERARGDSYNIIVILMRSRNLDVQAAMDHVGDMCNETLRTFQENKAKLPSWGTKIDKDVVKCVRGLEDWIAGSLHWSFSAERYFGERSDQIKQTRTVHLLPVNPRLPVV